MFMNFPDNSLRYFQCLPVNSSNRPTVVCVFLITCLAVSFLYAQNRTQASGNPDARIHQQENRSQVQATGDADTADWQELKNKWGWKIKFPRDWEAVGHDDDAPEVDPMPEIDGPKGCEASRICGMVLFVMHGAQPDVDQSKLSPEEYLLNYEGMRHYAHDTRAIQVGGRPACEMSPEGRLQLNIAVKHRKGFLTISYNEGNPDSAGARPPAVWKYRSVFEKMLSTFSFYTPGQPSAPRRVSGPPLDVSKIVWKRIDNQNGWSIEYPADWDVSGLGQFTPETTDEQQFSGPMDCSKTGRKCGWMFISSGYDDPAKAPKDRLREDADTNKLKIIASRSVKVGGEAADELTTLSQDGCRGSAISLNHSGESFYLNRMEYFTDPQNPLGRICSEPLEFAPVFDHMIASLRFIPGNGSATRSPEEKAFVRALTLLPEDALDSTTISDSFLDALELLDVAVLKKLNRKEGISIEELNQGLRGLNTGEYPLDGTYEVLAMRTNPPCYALTANLESLGGAIRFYATNGPGTAYRLAARLDFRSKEYFPSMAVKLLPIDREDGVFVTAHGETKFAPLDYKAWRFNGRAVDELWNSGDDVLTLDHVSAGGIVFTKCKVFPKEGETCPDSVQLRYGWVNGEWKELASPPDPRRSPMQQRR